MLNVCRNKAIEIRGFKVTDRNHYFVAVNDTIELQFIAEGRNGGLYFKPVGYIDKSNGRVYKAQRYLYKYIPEVRELASYLAENNYLWDYVQQRPFLNAKIDAMKSIDKTREHDGKPPLYKEYLESFDYSLID
jgi:hypothetical protein